MSNQDYTHNPIILGIVGGLVIYAIMYIDKQREIKNAQRTNQLIASQSVDYKIPVLVFLLIWSATAYIKYQCFEPSYDYEILLDNPDM